jgi:carboxylesterase type B
LSPAVQAVAAETAAEEIVALAAGQGVSTVAALKHISVVPAGQAIAGRAAEQEVAAFLGIPYAQAPVGERRWRKAMSLANAETITDAIAFGPTCRQARDENEVASMTPQGED